jgi:hypothetical protein
MSQIISDAQSNNNYMTSTVGGAVRWAAIELFSYQGNDVKPSLNANCDVYSFGSVVFQVRLVQTTVRAVFLTFFNVTMKLWW